MRGKLVGIVMGKLRESEGLNFGVASDTIQAFLGRPRAIRAPAPTATPTPRPRPPTPTRTPVPDYSGVCFQMGSSLSLKALNSIGPVAYGAFNPTSISDVCLDYARVDGMAGVQCIQFALQQEIDFIAIAAAARVRTPVQTPKIESLYAGCMGRD